MWDYAEAAFPDANDVEKAKTYTKAIIPALKSMPRRKAVDASDIPAEAWQLALQALKTKDGTVFLHNSDNKFYSFVVDFISFMLAGARTPTSFHLSRAWLLPKHNGKESCAAWRMIHGLPTMSRAFYKVHWKQCVDETSPPPTMLMDA